MIRRELPLTVIASLVEPVAQAKREFCFVLALAVADSEFIPVFAWAPEYSADSTPSEYSRAEL